MTDWNQADPPETLRLWLNTDPLTLFQAVMLALGRDPSLTSTGRPKAYGAMEQALRQAIRRSEVLGIKTLPNPGDWPSTRDVYSTGDEHEIYVHQIAMRQWLRKMEYEKAFFFLCHPKDWPGTAAPASEPAACTRWPWGDYETDLLRKLADAARRFWTLYDPADPTTAPTNKDVAEWLQAQGVAERNAQVMATILRADDLPTGPRK
ncbi:MAG: hypothetical protein JSS03_07235 [Proteobacteria bacterium]|nr:hypothetical protein [Pseudomonadota bacterium]